MIIKITNTIYFINTILSIYILILILKNNKIDYIVNFNSTINNYYVISLDNENGFKKWERMKSTILGKKLMKITGINGKEINIAEYIRKNLIKNKWDHGKWKYNKSNYINISPSEIGCCLSHLKVWNKINDDKSEISMILEDDAQLFYNDFENIVNKLLINVPNDWDIILLGYGVTPKMMEKEYNINGLYKVDGFVLTHCYLIRRKCVNILLKNLPIDMPIDTWISKHSDKINIYRHNMNFGKSTKWSYLIKQNTAEFGSGIEHTNNI